MAIFSVRKRNKFHFINICPCRCRGTVTWVVRCATQFESRNSSCQLKLSFAFSVFLVLKVCQFHNSKDVLTNIPYLICLYSVLNWQTRKIGHIIFVLGPHTTFRIAYVSNFLTVFYIWCTTKGRLMMPYKRNAFLLTCLRFDNIENKYKAINRDLDLSDLLTIVIKTVDLDNI